MRAHIVELLGILIALGLLIFLAFRGFTLLLAAIVGEPMWTYGSRSEIARYRNAFRLCPFRVKNRQYSD